MRALAWLTVALYVFNSAILVWLHFRVRDVHPVAHAVSDYGVGEYGALFKLHGVVGCVAALALAWLVSTSAQPVFPARIAGYLLTMAVARLVVGFAPTDGDDARPTTAGRVHTIAAAAVFICAVLVVVDGTRPLAQSSAGYASAWMALKWSVVVTMAGMIATRIERWRRAFGLFERGFIVVSTLWFMALALSFM